MKKGRFAQHFLHLRWLVLFLVCVTLFSHILYSWIGYNPTDDGFILAYSKRILNCEVPHRDFISIRPIGSAILHLPIVLLGGGYCYWFSRMFVWFQFACIAGLWTLIINETFDLNLKGGEKFIISLIAFVISVHYFPILAWHTIDGIFFVSVGATLCLGKSSKSKFFGYFLIGCSYLFKQNFALIAPLSIILLNDWRKIRYWTASCLPGIMYFLSLTIVGALPNMINQLTSTTNLWEIGVVRFIADKTVVWSIVIGFIVMIFAFDQTKTGSSKRLACLALGKKILATLIIFLIILSVLIGIAKGNYNQLASLQLFGVVLGISIYSLLRRRILARTLPAALLVAILGWSVAISIGVPFPSLVGGPMAVLLIGYVFFMLKTFKQPSIFRNAMDIVLIIAMFASLFAFHHARNNNVYRDMQSRYLTKQLGEVLRGGKMIKTSPRTYEFLEDLNQAVQMANGKNYAVLPDCAGYWVKVDQANPLPIDWAQGVELQKVSVYEMFLGKLEAQRGKIVIILEKTRAHTLNRGFHPIPIETNYYKVVKYVKENFTKFDETNHFALYH